MYIVQNLVAEHEGSTDDGLAEGGTSRRENCYLTVNTEADFLV